MPLFPPVSSLGVGPLSSSGYSLRHAGERTVWTRFENVGLQPIGLHPYVNKPIVLAESWGQPGILKQIWSAYGNYQLNSYDAALTSGINNSVTSAGLVAKSGLFPGAFPFYLIINDGGNTEIVQVTALASGTVTNPVYTIVRGQLGTSAVTHNGPTFTASMTSGSNIITATVGTFNSGQASGAYAALVPNATSTGGQIVGVITGFTDTTHITIDQNAGQNSGSVTVTVVPIVNMYDSLQQGSVAPATQSSTYTNTLAPTQDAGRIRIYIDHSTVPSVDLSFNDFFMVYPLVDSLTSSVAWKVYNGEYNDNAAAGRNLFMPFQKYMRVEVDNNSNSSGMTFYGSACYSLINNFAELGTQHRRYVIMSNDTAEQTLAPGGNAIPGGTTGTTTTLTPLVNKQTMFTVCDMDGAGQLTEIWVGVNAIAGNSDAGVMEGDVQIFVDNETWPAIMTSGMEDTFLGGWYQIPGQVASGAGVGTSPIGFTAGRTGPSRLGNGQVKFTWYRTFLHDPVYFTKHIKVQFGAGQPDQGAWSSSQIYMAGFAGVFLDNPLLSGSQMSYTSVNTSASALLTQTFSGTPGSSPTTDANGNSFVQPNSPTDQWVYGTGGNTLVMSHTASNSFDTYLASTAFSGIAPTSYWVEAKVRITDATDTGQEIHLFTKSTTGSISPGRCGVIWVRGGDTATWSVSVKDSFDLIAGVSIIGPGTVDYTNQYIDLALKVEGSVVTAYYRVDGATDWLSVAKWTTAQTGTYTGIGSFGGAGAEVASLTVRPISTFTS